MSIVGLVLRSLKFYWRTTLRVCRRHTGERHSHRRAGGGRFLRYTLEQQALARVGRATALSAPDRFFREDLARALMNDLATPVAPLLRSWARSPTRRHRLAANVQIVGVNDAAVRLREGLVRGSRRRRLRQTSSLLSSWVRRLVIRRPRGGTIYISRDAPLSGRADTSTAFRVQLRAIAGEAQFGTPVCNPARSRR